MKITLELLKKYGASNSIIEYFEKSGLEGAALIEIMDTENFYIFSVNLFPSMRKKKQSIMKFATLQILKMYGEVNK